MSRGTARNRRGGRALVPGVALLLAVLLGSPGGLSGQVDQRVAGGVTFKGYTLDPALGSEAADLLRVPIAYHAEIGDRWVVDLFGGWAKGRVEREVRDSQDRVSNKVFELSGLVDTEVRVSYRAFPWGVLSLGATIPNGKEQLNAEEAVVASVLAQDLLGFATSTWGTGGGITTAFAATVPAGQWNLGGAVSFRAFAEYEPQADQAFAYQPGNEFRVRLGADRNVGEDGKLTTGLSLYNFSTDQLEGRNLFEAGIRIRGDAAYSFRRGRSVWTVYAYNLWREQSQATPFRQAATGDFVPDGPPQPVGSQNLFEAGVASNLPLPRGLQLRPRGGFRWQSIEQIADPGGATEDLLVGPGSGWLFLGGVDLPLRLARAVDVFPGVAIQAGQMKDANELNRTVWGAEFSLLVRWGN